MAAETVESKTDDRGGLLAAGGVVGAVLAASCCVVPVVAVLLGAGGAWIGTLTVLAPYRAYVIGATLLLLAFGFWQVYGRARRECVEAAACARSLPRRGVKVTLWLATTLVGSAASADLWAPLFY